jgi:voltage-dependent potassium channel beta subunit
MKYRHVGRSGLKVSAIGLGSWLTFGKKVGLEGTRACVRAAVDEGIIFFDTADIYDRGEAERVLGRALHEIPRHHYVLATKVFWPMSDNPNDRGLSRKHIVEACEASLRRLGVDYVDLYQCHRYDPETPVDEVVLAMTDLVRQGKILYWGVSVWSAAQIRHALHVADRYLGYRPISNQPPYSLLERGIEAEVLPVCQAEGLGQVVFSPLAQGTLTGKYVGGRIPEDSRAADEQRNVFLKPKMTPENLQRVEAMMPLAKELGITPAQLALAWCLRNPGVASAIVGATRPEQVRENAAAAEVEIPEEIARRLDEIFPGPAAQGNP